MPWSAGITGYTPISGHLVVVPEKPEEEEPRNGPERDESEADRYQSEPQDGGPEQGQSDSEQEGQESGDELSKVTQNRGVQAVRFFHRLATSFGPMIRTSQTPPCTVAPDTYGRLIA